MGLFQFFWKNNKKAEENQQEQEPKPHIPRELFVKDVDDNVELYVPDKITITEVYKFIQQDNETKGFQDAYTTQDEKYKQQAIEMLKMDLRIYLQRAANFYNLEICEIDSHIESRKRAGLIDLVEQLNKRKQFLEDMLTQIRQLNDELDNEQGKPMRMIHSYSRGFTKGLAAISEAEVLNKKII